ncbi:unnamed protein product, partial [Vitis vinifera]|uniref:Uncharacterized protein n=1 Tax=Vitis vinifera TaxID=29760 RepID=D7U8H0_VITVI
MPCMPGHFSDDKVGELMEKLLGVRLIPLLLVLKRGGAPRAIPREMDELDSKIEPLLALQCPQPKKMKRSPL